MLAYHNRPELKDAVLTLIGEHERLDRLTTGTYARFSSDGSFSRGCAVGCTLESIRQIEGLPSISHSDHALYERYLGVPMVLARIEDALFENLPRQDALVWPRRFASAIRPGSDLSMVWPKWLRRVLADPDGGVQAGVSRQPRIKPSVDGVIALFDRWIETREKPPLEDWRSARDDADVAAAAAADVAAAAASSAAADAAAAAASAAASAASSAASASAADAADAAMMSERKRQADWLIELLEAA